MGQICQRLNLDRVTITLPETEPVSPAEIEERLTRDPSISHVALVHCETTTGLLNPADEIGRVVKSQERRYIVDAMSSFGGIPMSMDSLSADFLVSSANKCIQGVPGFGFVIARQGELERTEGWARSLSLDLFDQWREMETKQGKWRYTSPTHVVLAFQQALRELDAEGGVAARHGRYVANHQTLVSGMERIGFKPLVDKRYRSPIITSFLYPEDEKFDFMRFYEALKKRRFVIYPGKVSHAETFRIGTIGHLDSSDVRLLIESIGQVVRELGLKLQNS
jgi:2-aminoethylphosphonate-pyruvate transaminase